MEDPSYTLTTSPLVSGYFYKRYTTVIRLQTVWKSENVTPISFKSHNGVSGIGESGWTAILYPENFSIGVRHH